VLPEMVPRSAGKGERGPVLIYLEVVWERAVPTRESWREGALDLRHAGVGSPGGHNMAPMREKVEGEWGGAWWELGLMSV
jgi:hypothetical protein